VYTAILLEDTKKFKKGDLIKNIKRSPEGIIKEDDLIPYDKVLILNEALSTQDIAQVKKIVKDILKLVFWRLYTRNSFVLQ